MANEYMERCSSPITREMAIKTIVRYLLTPIRGATIQKAEKKC